MEEAEEPPCPESEAAIPQQPTEDGRGGSSSAEREAEESSGPALPARTGRGVCYGDQSQEVSHGEQPLWPLPHQAAGSGPRSLASPAGLAHQDTHAKRCGEQTKPFSGTGNLKNQRAVSHGRGKPAALNADAEEVCVMSVWAPSLPSKRRATPAPCR